MKPHALFLLAALPAFSPAADPLPPASERFRAARGDEVPSFQRHVVPLILRVTTRSSQPGLLMKYYWDTIAECVPAETILAVMRDAGFVDVDRKLSGGVLSEYVARKPAPPAPLGAPGSS